MANNVQSSDYLSIIIPACNEAGRIGGTVERVFAFLNAQPFASEVIVVENGSTDETAEVVESFIAQYPKCSGWRGSVPPPSNTSQDIGGTEPHQAEMKERSKKKSSLRLLRVARRAKGLAVQRGMLAAGGEYRFLCDADLSMPIEQVLRFLPPHCEADLAIGSRELAESDVSDSPSRRFLGRWFNRLTRWLLLPGLRDTQCGFKCFRAGVAEDIFQYLRIEGLAFDVEVLYRARQRGWRIVEVPITWQAKASGVRVVRDGLAMLRDLLRIRHHKDHEGHEEHKEK